MRFGEQKKPMHFARDHRVAKIPRVSRVLSEGTKLIFWILGRRGFWRIKIEGYRKDFTSLGSKCSRERERERERS